MSPGTQAGIDLDNALEKRIREIRDRITAACDRSGRDPDEVTLVAVSKTFPSSSVLAAHASGVLDFGENRVQELVEKADEISGLDQRGTIRWHMLGHLQRNKAKDVVRVARLFHALDSERLARELNKRAVQAERTLECLIQVNTSGEESKEGVSPDDVSQLVRNVLPMDGLVLRGFMTIAAPADDPEQVRHEFREMAGIRNRLRETHPDVPLDFLSMGMSGDFEVAIEEGATHVRIGRLLFGDRG